jgi:predicted  nucleic acid-binding Zn-ribbon protein
MAAYLPKMRGTLDALVELHGVLTRLEQARARCENVPEPLRQLQTERDQVTAEIATLDATAAEVDRERRAAEAAAADEQSKISHFEEQISRVTTQREYGALLAEIDGARERKRQHEDGALGAMEKVDGARGRSAELAGRLAELEAQAGALLAEWESDRPAARAAIDALEHQASLLRERIPAPALQLYQRLQKRHGADPLARIDRVERPGAGPVMWRCSVCNYSVRPQVVVEIQTQGELVVCDCGRQRLFFLGPSVTT